MTPNNSRYPMQAQAATLRHAYGELVETHWDDDDRQIYLVTIQCHAIPGPRPVVLEIMFREADHFYRALLKNSERNPRSPARQMFVPIMLGQPDIPVRKNAKSSIADVTINGGLHMQFIVITHLGSRMKVDLDEHVYKNAALYLGASGVKRSIHIEHVDRTPGKTTEYVFKFLGRADFGFDYAFIRPMAISEQPVRGPQPRPPHEPNFLRRTPIVST